MAFTETEDKDAKSSKKKGKGKDASSKKGEGKGGKGSKKSKPSLSNEEVQEPKDQPKGKGEKGKKKSKPSLNNEDIQAPKDQAKEKDKEPKRKSKKKSKSSEDVKITHKNKEDADVKSTDTSIKKIKKSITLEEAENIRRLQIEEKLKLFDRPIAPDMKLEMKKIEVKDKFILPLSEGVSKGYVENLIKSILPQEARPLANANVPKEKSEGKSKESSSLEGKKKKSSSLEGKKKKGSKADKKSKGKKK